MSQHPGDIQICVYRHQDDPEKMMKIYKGTISLKEAKNIATKPSRGALVNRACDKTADLARVQIKGGGNKKNCSQRGPGGDGDRWHTLFFST